MAPVRSLFKKTARSSPSSDKSSHDAHDTFDSDDERDIPDNDSFFSGDELSDVEDPDWQQDRALEGTAPVTARVNAGEGSESDGESESEAGEPEPQAATEHNHPIQARRRAYGRKRRDPCQVHQIFKTCGSLFQRKYRPRGFSKDVFAVRKRILKDRYKWPSLNNMQCIWTKFGAWCERKHVPPLATADNLNGFLTHCVRDPAGVVAQTKGLTIMKRVEGIKCYLTELAKMQQHPDQWVTSLVWDDAKAACKKRRQEIKHKKLRESSHAAALSRVLTQKELRGLSDETWADTIGTVAYGRRTDLLMKILRAVGQRGGELSQLRLQQLYILDVVEELGAHPDAYENHEALAGDPIMLRWETEEKSEGISDRTRGVVRCPEVVDCPISALALHLSWQIDAMRRHGHDVHFGGLIPEILSGEMTSVLQPDGEFQDVEAWWTTHLLYGGQQDEGLRPNTIGKQIRRTLQLLGIRALKRGCMHLFRRTRLRYVDNMGSHTAAREPWSHSNGTCEKTYEDACINLEGAFVQGSWGPKWRDRHVMGRHAATWEMVEGEEWLDDPDLAHLTGIPAYIKDRLFAGVDELVAERGSGEGINSAKYVAHILRWCRSVFMQDLPFWVGELGRGGTHYFTLHPLFMDDSQGHFRQWLAGFWAPRVLALHADGLALLREIRTAPKDRVTMPKIHEAIAGIQEGVSKLLGAAPNSPEQRKSAHRLAKAIEKVASPVAAPTAPAPQPQRPKKPRGDGKVRLTIAARHEDLQGVVDEYLRGSPGAPALADYMIDFKMDRDRASWAGDSREGTPALKQAWLNRKALVQGLVRVADTLPDGMPGAIARLTGLAQEQGLTQRGRPVVSKLETMAKRNGDAWQRYLAI